MIYEFCGVKQTTDNQNISKDELSNHMLKLGFPEIADIFTYVIKNLSDEVVLNDVDINESGAIKQLLETTNGLTRHAEILATEKIKRLTSSVESFKIAA